MVEKSPLKPFWPPPNNTSNPEPNNQSRKRTERIRGGALHFGTKKEANGTITAPLLEVTDECIPELEVVGVGTEIPRITKDVPKVHIS